MPRFCRNLSCLFLNVFSVIASAAVCYTFLLGSSPLFLAGGLSPIYYVLTYLMPVHFCSIRFVINVLDHLTLTMYFLLQSYLHTHTDKATWLKSRLFGAGPLAVLCLISSTFSKPFSVFFFDEFNSFLSFAATTPHEFIITGDFNIHLDNLSDHTTSQFLSLLSSLT